MKNERFSSYYQAQNIIPEDEWESFMDALRTPLPTTFRVAGSRQCVWTVQELFNPPDLEAFPELPIL